VRVRDNGVGIDPALVEKGKPGHFGLQEMRERVARIGGTNDRTHSVIIALRRGLLQI